MEVVTANAGIILPAIPFVSKNDMFGILYIEALELEHAVIYSICEFSSLSFSNS